MRLTAEQEAARALGSKGGKSGRGASKRRSAAHYAKLAAMKRKMASAMIAKIPLALSTHIARTYYPRIAA
jgi:hypothetical protein